MRTRTLDILFKGMNCISIENLNEHYELKDKKDLTSSRERFPTNLYHCQHLVPNSSQTAINRLHYNFIHQLNLRCNQVN